jgi:hypothetical protein
MGKAIALGDSGEYQRGCLTCNIVLGSDFGGRSQVLSVIKAMVLFIISPQALLFNFIWVGV